MKLQTRLIRILTALIWSALLIETVKAQVPAPGASFWPPVLPGRTLTFPQDHGAHPAYKTEWWYATGWLQGEDDLPLGFQVTFFRIRPGLTPGNPSAFTADQLIFAHAALSDPKPGRLQHDQRIARAGFGIAEARTGDADIRLDRWHFTRDLASGSFNTAVRAPEFSYQLTLTPTAPLLLQGEGGYSRKGPDPLQASYYYSLPHLKVSGSVERKGKRMAVTGTAWLDHEWSSQALDARAAGWDWVGLNLDDGGALMAFQIRNRSGSVLWTAATLRGANGGITRFEGEQVVFETVRTWRSGRTRATYPVEQRLRVGPHRWRLAPLMDDQELDSRASTGLVYWEGAVRAVIESDSNSTVGSPGRSTGGASDRTSGHLSGSLRGTSPPSSRENANTPVPHRHGGSPPDAPRAGPPVSGGRGYLELTGYHRALKL